jgi:hypothetical protein
MLIENEGHQNVEIDKPREAELLLEPGHYYSDRELTVDGRHRYCSGCDVFRSVAGGCHHFDADRRGAPHWQLVVFRDGFHNLILPGTWRLTKVFRKMKTSYPKARLAHLVRQAVQ